MNADEIIKNFRKEKAYALGFAEGVTHAVWIFNNCVKAAIPDNRPLEKGSLVGGDSPELIKPGCPNILIDVLKDQPIVELNIDLKEEIKNSNIVKKIREELQKNKKEVQP
jgi:hypothetical protein